MGISGMILQNSSPRISKHNSKRSQTWFSTLERYMILQHPTPRKFNSEFFSLKNDGWKDFCFPFGMVYFQGRHVKLQVGKQKHATDWWFQPIWKIWVNMGNLPQIGMKIKTCFKPPARQISGEFPWNDGRKVTLGLVVRLDFQGFFGCLFLGG